MIKAYIYGDLIEKLLHKYYTTQKNLISQYEQLLIKGELLVKSKIDNKSSNIILYDKSNSTESIAIISQFENEMKESIYQILQNYFNKMTKILPKRLFILKEVTNCFILKIVNESKNLFSNVSNRIEKNLAIMNTLEQLSLCQGFYYFYYCESLIYFFYKDLYIPKVRITFPSSILNYYDIKGIKKELKKEINDENSNNSNLDKKTRCFKPKFEDIKDDSHRIKSKK